MPVLALVGAPASKLSYEAFKALKAAGGFTGAVLGAAEAAAIGSIVGFGAAVLGAGAGGILIGQSILRGLEYTGAEPTIRQKYKTAGNQGKIRVLSSYKQINAPVVNFDDLLDSPIVGPVSDPNVNNPNGYGILEGDPARFRGYVTIARELIEQPFTIDSVAKANGQPAEGLRKVPGYPTINPVFPVKTPTTVPVQPGTPDFPITPEIAPPTENPGEGDDINRVPGVAVKIPELGVQLRFTPDGVTIGVYTDPSTKPFEFPNAPKQPNAPAQAKDPCCEQEEDKRPDEILCRVKTLQDEILDDGETLQIRPFPESSGTSVTNLGKGFRYVEIDVQAVPVNNNAQNYSAGIPSVYHCGWVAFEINGQLSERIPLQFLSSTFPAPEGSTGYTVAMNRGYTASTAAYIYTKKDYVDTCTQ